MTYRETEKWKSWNEEGQREKDSCKAGGASREVPVNIDVEQMRDTCPFFHSAAATDRCGQRGALVGQQRSQLRSSARAQRQAYNWDPEVRTLRPLPFTPHRKDSMERPEDATPRLAHAMTPPGWSTVLMTPPTGKRMGLRPGTLHRSINGGSFHHTPNGLRLRPLPRQGSANFSGTRLGFT